MRLADKLYLLLNKIRKNTHKSTLASIQTKYINFSKKDIQET